ncbi:MAG: transposase [Cyanosarcina radialis HA8281-LM2]|nr:transposase [Cyanosarcina radialis HA8281-LM2]
MSQILTVSCKLNPTWQQVEKLEATLMAFAEACNWVNQNTSANILNAVKLQSQIYYEVRDKFGLSSNLAQQVCRRVAGNRKTAKQKNKPVKKLNPSSVTYDQRIFAFREPDWMVSLTTTGGRERIALDIGNYQRHLLKGQKPTGATLVKRRNGDYYIQICVNYQTPQPDKSSDCLGVDLGRRDIAVSSDGHSWSGRTVRQTRDHYSQMRAVLQRKASKGTRSRRRRCRQLLRRLTGREKRFQSWMNHRVSKTLVDHAQANGQSIALEDLTGIRNRTNQQPRSQTERRHSNSWAFYQLRQYISYKALAKGVEVVLVNPAYTSQTCHVCNQIGLRAEKRFSCGHCGWCGDADFNGAMNIKALVLSVNQPRGSWLSCEIAGGLLKADAVPSSQCG